MSKFEKMVENGENFHIIFGHMSDHNLERKLLNDLSRLDGRAKKAADVAISMFMGFFDPDSKYATPADMLGMPVVLGYASNRHPKNKGQIDAFTTVGKAMFIGRLAIDDLLFPYKKDISAVCVDEAKGIMIVGQKIHSHFRPDREIPGIDEEIGRMNELFKESPDSTPYIPPHASMHYMVLAHANRDGVNSDLYSSALHSHNLRIANRSELMRVEYSTLPLDFSATVKSHPKA